MILKIIACFILVGSSFSFSKSLVISGTVQSQFSLKSSRDPAGVDFKIASNSTAPLKLVFLGKNGKVCLQKDHRQGDLKQTLIRVPASKCSVHKVVLRTL